MSLLSFVYANDKSIVVQSTTSTENSGLYDHILPLFKQSKNITVYIVAVGTGQAIKNAKNCDGDVLLVHSKSDEIDFVNSGFGVKRDDLMYNDFIIIGPENDPAKIKQVNTASQALTNIANKQSVFASRGDESGTHKKEMQLWQNTHIDPTLSSGKWYRETGTGMGATLNTAVGMQAYSISDRGTWISFNNKRNLKILFQGDKKLFNQYGVIQVNPKKCPKVKDNLSSVFIDWLLSPTGQQAIENYKIQGEQLFIPNAKKID